MEAKHIEVCGHLHVLPALSPGWVPIIFCSRSQFVVEWGPCSYVKKFADCHIVFWTLLFEEAHLKNNYELSNCCEWTYILFLTKIMTEGYRRNQVSDGGARLATKTVTPCSPWNNPVAHKLGVTDLVDRRLDGSQSKLSHICSDGKLVSVVYGK